MDSERRSINLGLTFNGTLDTTAISVSGVDSGDTADGQFIKVLTANTAVTVQNRKTSSSTLTTTISSVSVQPARITLIRMAD